MLELFFRTPSAAYAALIIAPVLYIIDSSFYTSIQSCTPWRIALFCDMKESNGGLRSHNELAIMKIRKQH